MRALAISGLDRAKLLPEIPTLTEVGVKMSEELSWYGFFDRLIEGPILFVLTLNRWRSFAWFIGNLASLR